MMRRGFASLCLLAALVAGIGPARADTTPIDAAAKAALARTIETFDGAMREANVAHVFETMPARILELIATRAGLSVDALRAAMSEHMRSTLATVRFESFGFDMSKADYRRLPSGEPFVLIPTSTMILTNGERVRQTSTTLALPGDGKWYLLRISDDNQLALLHAAYPQFRNVEISLGTMEFVK